MGDVYALEVRCNASHIAPPAPVGAFLFSAPLLSAGSPKEQENDEHDGGRLVDGTCTH